MSVCSNEAKVGSRIVKALKDAYEVLLHLFRDPKADRRQLYEWKCENYSSRLVCSSDLFGSTQQSPIQMIFCNTWKKFLVCFTFPFTNTQSRGIVHLRHGRRGKSKMLDSFVTYVLTYYTLSMLLVSALLSYILFHK